MIFSAVKKLHHKYTSRQWSSWWKNRQIDWKVSYLDTWNHPHRVLLCGILNTFTWYSLYEIGCGAGANFLQIIKSFPPRQLGGCDVNKDAIDLLKKTFGGAVVKVGSAEDIFMSDNSADVVLSDMCLIYVGPYKIDKYVEEIKRVARNYALFCEFHSKSWYDRMKLWLSSGYHAHNYIKLLHKHGFHDVVLYKIPEEFWPGADYNQKFRFIIKASVPRRKGV